MGLLPVAIVAVVVLVFAVTLVIVFSTRKGEVGKNGKGRRLQAKDRPHVLKEANRRLAANPKDLEALAALGSLAWDDQDWERVFKIYETIAEAGAGNPDVNEYEANERYGIAALRLGKNDAAYHGLMVARSIKQDGFEVNYNLGVLEYQQKSYEKAVVLFKQAVALQGDNAMALRYLGNAYFKVKSYKEALAALRKAIDQEPDDKEALFAAAECYYELGNLDQALKVFSHLRADPVLGPSASLFAGTVHLNQRLYERAVADFEIGLKHQGAKLDTVLELKYRLAAAALKMQNIGRAVSLLNEIQAAYPNFKDVPVLLAKYKELNSNRNLQIFLLGTASDFVTLCRKIALLYFPKAKVKITDISVQGNEYADILAEIETSKWTDLILFRFIRSQGTIGELSVRDFHARVKDLKAGRGYCITAGTFSEEARRFVEARLIDLIDKSVLLQTLNSIDARSRGLLADA
jgi:tetratricopeptide (TPR) repeat protein